MAAGQRVEVDKCVPANEYLTLWEEDTADFDDHIGEILLSGDETRDYSFCCGSNNARYRLGAVS